MVQLSKETLDALSKFFEPKQVQWKPQTTNREKTKALATAYIDARDVMNRLDRVVGGDWQFTWDLMPDGEVRGMLTVCGVTRSDVGERGDGSFGNTLKAAVSDALKRSAVHFGVGRYLYYLPGQWVGYDQQRKCLTETPRLPAWALPGSEPKIADEAGPAVAAEELAMPQDGDQHERGRTQGQPKPSNVRPWEPEMTRTMISKKIAQIDDMRDASSDQSNLTAGRLNDLFGNKARDQRDQLRHSLLMYLLGTDTTKWLTVGQCKALLAWSSDTMVEDGKTNWLPNEDAVSEAAKIVAEYHREHGQSEMDLEAVGL